MIDALGDWLVCHTIVCPNPYDSAPTSSSNYWFNTYSSEQVCDTFIVLALRFIVVSIALIIALIHHICWQWHTNKYDSAGVGPTAWLQSNSPFVLGIGISMSNILTFIWFFFPQEWIGHQTGRAFTFALLARVLATVVAVWITVGITKWRDWHYSKCPRDQEVSQEISLKWSCRFGVDLLVESLPFMFCWQATQFCYEVFFHGLFRCTWPFMDCSEDRLVWMWVMYSILFTAVTFKMVPKVNASSFQLRELDVSHVFALLRHDSHLLQRSKIVDTLAVSLGGIGVGWAYTQTANAECIMNLSPTCPKSLNGVNLVLYLVTIVAYIWIIAFFLHRYLESHRLASRVSKVMAIEDGNDHFLFDEINASKDGLVSVEELILFVKGSGLSADIFMTAFNTLVKQKETDKIPPEILMREVTRQLGVVHDGLDTDGSEWVDLDMPDEMVSIELQPRRCTCTHDKIDEVLHETNKAAIVI